MGFLDNSSITIDAVLTKLGKEKLANGNPLGITQFGCSDDMIDYSLWNPGNTGGTDQYGQAIEDLPMLESPVINSQAFRYSLGTGQGNLLANPYLILDATEYTLRYSGENQGTETIRPQTGNYNSSEQYIFHVSNNAGFNFSPGGRSVDTRTLEAPLPQGDREEQMEIGPATHLDIWPISTDTTLVTSILVEGADTGALANVRVTALAND